MTGLGGEVRIPLSDVAIGTASNLGGIAEVLYEGKNRERLGNAVYGLFGRDFVSADSVRMMIVVVTPKQWSNLVSALKLEDAVAKIEAERGTSFAVDDGARFTHRDALYPLFSAAIAGWQYDQLAEVLDKLGCVYGRYNSMLEATRDPRLVTANPMFAQTSDNPSGFAYPAAGSMATIPSLERGEPVRAPVNGEHSEEVLSQWLKLDSTEFSKLVDQRIVGVGA
jgi:2-methylfumaryl-CoA isomerase